MVAARTATEHSGGCKYRYWTQRWLQEPLLNTAVVARTATEHSGGCKNRYWTQWWLQEPLRNTAVVARTATEHSSGCKDHYWTQQWLQGPLLNTEEGFGKASSKWNNQYKDLKNIELKQFSYKSPLLLLLAVNQKNHQYEILFVPYRIPYVSVTKRQYTIHSKKCMLYTVRIYTFIGHTVKVNKF